MSRYNRPGKREREARRRHKRCKTTIFLHTPTGTKSVTLKLGRRKSSNAFAKLSRDGMWHLEEKLRRIPVADVRELRREKSL